MRYVEPGPDGNERTETGCVDVLHLVAFEGDALVTAIHEGVKHRSELLDGVQVALTGDGDHRIIGKTHREAKLGWGRRRQRRHRRPPSLGPCTTDRRSGRCCRTGGEHGNGAGRRLQRCDSRMVALAFSALNASSGHRLGGVNLYGEFPMVFGIIDRAKALILATHWHWSLHLPSSRWSTWPGEAEAPLGDDARAGPRWCRRRWW